MKSFIKKHPIGSLIGLATAAFLIVQNLSILSQLGHYPKKIWLHRANSFEKMLEKEERFPNFEVDVVFRPDSTFDVTHDDHITYEQTLDPYLADIAADDDHMWLDIKNLTSENADAMQQHIDSLCAHYDVAKDQLILESRNYRELEQFTDSGYYTSYYVDFPKPSRLTDEEIDLGMHHLRQVAQSGQVEALSFPGWWYEEISEHLGDLPIDLLTWKHRTTEYELLSLLDNRQMLIDPQVKVILVKSKGEHHR